MKTFGEYLKEKREKKGLSQSQVALKLGVSPMMVSNYERNNFEPDLRKIVTLSVLLEFSIDAILKKYFKKAPKKALQSNK